MEPFDLAKAAVFAAAFVGLTLLVPERKRRAASAIVVAGAATMYANNGLGALEVPYAIAALYVAYRGLASYRWIGVAWLMHATWDLVHCLNGQEMLGLVPHSSLGCALSDPLIALWFLTRRAE
jgi:hypothetical protein